MSNVLRLCGNKPLPLGEVARRSRDGEGEQMLYDIYALSVSLTADSSPKGRAFRADVGIRPYGVTPR